METELTKAIKTALWKFTDKQGTFGCFEVTIGWFGNERVDYMTYDTKGNFRCYEIKVSVSDFHSKNHNTFVGHLNYYVLPESLYSKVKDEIPNGIGVVIASENTCLKNGFWNVLVKKKPKRRAPSVDIQILKDSMIRSLDREVGNARKSQDPDIIKCYNREIMQLKKENQKLRNQNLDLQNELYFSKHPERKTFELEEIKR